MRLLLDHCVDRRLCRYLAGHESVTARAMGWDRLRNGELLAAAEAGGFAVLVTVDRNMRHQQRIAGRRIAVIVVAGRDTRLTGLVLQVPAILQALEGITPGSVVTIGQS
jgi:predicted nuclease of predicted toxin-antitoxin system